MNSAKNNNFLPVILATLITALGFGIFVKFQNPITYELNLLFDGNEYGKAYAFFSGQADQYDVKYPFNVRILIPWLASKMPFAQPQHDFLAINLVFALLFVPAWFYACKIAGLNLKKGLFGWFWMTFHWVGLLKANIMDPINVDVPLYLFQLFLFIALLEKRWLLLLFLAPVATLQKESMLPTLIVLCLYPGLEWLLNGNKKAFWVLVSASILSFVAFKWASVHYAGQEAEQHVLVNLLNNLADRIAHPFSFVRWFLAIGLAFGPFLWVWIWNYRISIDRMDPAQKILLPMVPLYVFFSFLAGGDFTRLAFLGTPFLILLFLQKIKLTKRQWLLLGLLALPAMRLWEWIPDGGADFDAYRTWYPEFATVPYLILYGSYALLVMLVSRKWLIQKPAFP